MSTTTSNITRSSGPKPPEGTEKYRAVAEHLRQQITRGALQPGQRLPSWDRIEANFRVSRITVKRVMEELQAAGIVRTVRRGGTYVVDRPPSLCRFGIVLRGDEAGRFEQALLRQAQQIMVDRGLTFAHYRGVDGHADSEGYRELLTDLDRGRLAGLIVVAPTDEIQASPLFQDPRVPTVALLGQPVGRVPVVHTDAPSFYRRALEVMRREGRRRPAVIAFHKLLPVAKRLIREAGLDADPHLMQAANLQAPHTTKDLVRLLVRVSDADTLIIADDSLVEHAQAGLAAAAARVPEDLLLIEHCNWPWPVPSVLPAVRIGFDTAHVLKACLNLLDANRHGRDTPPETVIEATTEPPHPETEGSAPNLL